jgi:Bacterial regulatory proteins, luxR family
MLLVTAGIMNKQVAGDLGISEITAKVHRGAAMRKMGARTLVDLVRMADIVKPKQVSGAPPTDAPFMRSSSARFTIGRSADPLLALPRSRVSLDPYVNMTNSLQWLNGR